MKKGIKNAALTVAAIALLSACGTGSEYSWEETNADQLNAILSESPVFSQQEWIDDYGKAMCGDLNNPKKGVSHALGLLGDDYTSEESWTILSGIRNTYCPEFDS